MSLQPLLAGACAVAGVGLLAGPGWALLLAAALLYFAPARSRVLDVARRARGAAAAAGRWLVAGRRQAKAAAAAPVAVIGLAVGLSLALGLGWGIAAASVAVGYLSLAADKAE